MTYTILFTGHMIDAAGRTEPRFPAEKEAAAAQKIKAALLAEREKHNEANLQGISSGACGGDILFQEACVQLGIPTEVYLALPPEDFKQTSVSVAGKKWEDRFDALLQKRPVHILPATKNQNVWEATNDWMLQEALKVGGPNMVLIALWNEQGGDGPGGTQHMVQVAQQTGAEVIIIRTQYL